MTADPAAASAATSGDRLIAADANTARSSLVISITTLIATALGGAFALAVTLIVGAGPESDGFFAAYSAYTAFIVFGTSMRVALVPQLGPASEPQNFRANSADRVGRLLPVMLLASLVFVLLAPLIGYALTIGAPHTTRTVAIESTALLSIAAFFQIWAAITSAVLVGARRFAATSIASVLSLCVSVAVGVVLLYAVGIVGASIGMVVGAASFAIGQMLYLRRFDFHAHPLVKLITTRETWLVAGRMTVAAVLPIVIQLYLTVSLAAISSQAGAVTAYTYAYLVMTVISAISIGTIGMVSMPAAVDAVHAHGEQAAVPFLRDAGAAGFFLFWPLALCYALFGYPIVKAVFGGSLDANSLDVLWDTSRTFLLLGLVWSFGIPFTTFALARHLYSRVAIVAVILLPLHALTVFVVPGDSPQTIAAAHVAGGALLFAVLSVVITHAQSYRAFAAMSLAALPAFLLGGVFVAIRLLVGAPSNVAVAVGCAVLGGLAYLALSVKLAPNLGGRMVNQLRGRNTPEELPAL